MRFGNYGDYDRGFDIDQTEAWQIRTEELLDAPFDPADTVANQELAGQLKSQVLTIFRDPDSRFTIHGNTTVFPSYEEDEELQDAEDWAKLQSCFFDSNLQVSTHYSPNWSERLVWRSISRASGLERLPHVLSEAEAARTAIDARFEVDRSLYGNKYANLVATQEIVHRLNRILGEDTYSVPAFTAVPVHYHEKYMAGTLTAEYTQMYESWLEDKSEHGYYVRSSAVHAEDADSTTGAGLYESVYVPAEVGAAGLLDAMRQVYESVDSDQARQVRADLGIEHEEMGIIIQVNAAAADQSARDKYSKPFWGYSNGVVPGVATLMESYITGFDEEDKDAEPPLLRMPYHRSEVLIDLAHPPHTYGDKIWWSTQLSNSYAEYFKFDGKRGDRYGVYQASYLSRFSELVYGGPVQQEYIYGGKEGKFHALQTRPLPDSFTNPREAFQGFPDTPPLYTGRALGIVNGLAGNAVDCDTVENGLADQNTDYILTVEDNFTMSNFILGRNLQLVKGVIVIDDTALTRGQAAHVETLCAERGIPCAIGINLPDKDEIEGTTTIQDRILRLGRVTLYMDGLEARVYAS